MKAAKDIEAKDPIIAEMLANKSAVKTHFTDGKKIAVILLGNTDRNVPALEFLASAIGGSQERK